MPVWPKALREAGVLGMNARNVNYISRYNKRRFYPIVDDKLKTKHSVGKAGLPTPDLYGTIESYHDLVHMDELVSSLSSFVIKPSSGSGGKGILVVMGRDGDNFIKSSGAILNQEGVRRHIGNILSGLYSLGGKPDVAMIEELILFDDSMSNYSYEGAPDIRIIVFKGFPVMAMMRCATKESDGKANLHQGAVGVGIDLDSGKSVRAVWHDKPITIHPDTKHEFADLQLPHWQRMLELAASCYEMTSLGYLGCDIILDRKRGPVILEINARPGLSIQIANGVGLLTRLRAIEALPHEQLEVSAKKRVTFSQEHFAHPDKAQQELLVS